MQGVYNGVEAREDGAEWSGYADGVSVVIVLSKCTAPKTKAR